MHPTAELGSRSNIRAVVEAEALREGWAHFLDGFEWDWFGSLSFRQPQTPEAAQRRFAGWVRRVEQRSCGAVNWFYVIENSPAGLAHVHCLAKTHRSISVSDMRGAWSLNGFADIVRYDPSRGARFYLVKEVGTARLLDWDLSRKLKLRQPDT